ncbi:transposon Ty3-I Gag-Pol polyprotein [Trichonephila clavipes]|nr:transposon Ty3-I Gag-Pol polyprotein [Trichonephila clavipes]
MQQLCFVLDINQSLIPVYYPHANPVERKNRDLKPRLAMMVGNNHTLWIEKLPDIRFVLNTSKCESTDHTAAYLTFARELRTLDQVNTDLRSVIHNDNFVPEFTPYLKRFEGYMSQIKENIEMSQDRQKTYADKSRRPSPNYKVNDLVWVKLHPLSKATSCDKPDEPLGVYHTSALTPFLNGTQTQSPVVPLKKRGRTRKQPLIPRGTAGENAIMSASTPPRRDGLRRSEICKKLFNGDHALASSTTLRIIMSDSSDHMEFSPTKFEQVSACEKLRDTVTGISALHKSIHGMDGRSPSPRNSFKDLYLTSTQAMIRRKEEMVSELKTLPPCTRSDCQDHKIPSTSVEEEINFETPLPENKINTVSKPNKIKLCKKRKQKSKESTEEFYISQKDRQTNFPDLDPGPHRN